MLKAFTKVTADKAHFSIDIKNLTTLLFNQYSVTDSQEHSNISLTTSFPFKLLHNLLYQLLYRLHFQNISTTPIIKPILPFYNYSLLFFVVYYHIYSTCLTSLNVLSHSWHVRRIYLTTTTLGFHYNTQFS